MSLRSKYIITVLTGSLMNFRSINMKYLDNYKL